MFAKICGVDLRSHRFPEDMIDQTSVARISAILIRRPRRACPAFDLMADSASAVYLWRCAADAMIKFDGGSLGLVALQDLGV